MLLTSEPPPAYLPLTLLMFLKKFCFFPFKYPVCCTESEPVVTVSIGCFPVSGGVVVAMDIGPRTLHVQDKCVVAETVSDLFIFCFESGSR